MKKQDPDLKILKERVKMDGLMFGEGTREIPADGFGLLAARIILSLCPDDIVSQARFALWSAERRHLAGQSGPTKENERYFARLRVEAINIRALPLAPGRVGILDLS